MKVSIALCTKNGEKFLRTQLTSFVDQTLQADEIIVCDDGSTDTTIQILEQFKQKLPLQIHQNETCLGTFSNFEKAISLCTGDIIFPSDQDDFWESQKLERMVTYFQLNPSKQVIFSNAKLVDEFGKVVKKKRLWESFRFREQQQKEWREGKELEILIDGNRVTGCTMAIKKEFMATVLPFPKNMPSFFLHDAWIGIMGAVYHQIDFIPVSYNQYRLHALQQIGISENPKKAPNLLQRIQRPHEEKIQPYIDSLIFLMKLKDAIRTKSATASLEVLESKIDFLSNRAYLPMNRFKRIPKVFKNLLKGHYHRFNDIDAGKMNPYLMFLGDLIE